MRLLGVTQVTCCWIMEEESIMGFVEARQGWIGLDHEGGMASYSGNLRDFGLPVNLRIKNVVSP